MGSFSSEKLYNMICSINSSPIKKHRSLYSSWDDVMQHCLMYPADTKYLDVEIAITKHAPREVLVLMIDENRLHHRNPRNGWSLLHTALKSASPIRTIEYLLDSTLPRGQLATVLTNLGCSALHFAAAYRSSRRILELLVKSYPAAISIQDRWGRTPLILAIQAKASRDVLKFLIEKSPRSALMKLNEFDNTPLAVACSDIRPSDEIISLLISRASGSLFLRNKNGSTPLMLACRYNVSDKMCSYLMSKVFPTSNFLQELFVIIPEFVIDIILSYVPNPIDFTDSESRSVLHWCCTKKRGLDLVQSLIKRSTNISTLMSEDERGRTPLTICEDNNMSSVLRILKETEKRIHRR